MAKAKKITGIDKDARALEGAVIALRTRFGEILSFRDQALKKGDVGGVHAMRVATRRLRSTLKDFKPLFRNKPLKPVKSEIKQVAGVLGAVRDRDVSIITLKRLGLKTKNKQIRNGVENLIKRRRAVRENARIDLEKFLSTHDLSKLQKRFDSAIEDSSHKKKANAQFKYDEFGLSAIEKKLEEFSELSKGIYKPYDAEALHEFRLSTKRLRYAIELFAPDRHPKLVKYSVKISRLQDFLGEVHDCDVWIEALSNDLLNDDFKVSDYQTDAWLFSRFTEIRNKNYRSAFALCKSWKESNLLTKFGKTLS